MTHEWDLRYNVDHSRDGASRWREEDFRAPWKVSGSSTFPRLWSVAVRVVTATAPGACGTSRESTRD